MKKERQKYTPEDRLSILKEAEREGQASTIRKYQIAPSLYGRWKLNSFNNIVQVIGG